MILPNREAVLSLDSSGCLAVLRHKAGLEKLPDPALTGIPVIVAGELWTGVQKNLKTHLHQAARLEAFLSLFRFADAPDPWRRCGNWC